MSLDAALLTARSGLLHTQRALATAADDVANAGAVGHTDKRLEGRALRADGATGVRSLEPMREVDEALLAELNTRRAGAAAAEVRERLLQRIELAHGRPEAGEGVGDLVASLNTAFLALRAEPGDAGRQADVVLAAEGLANRLNEVSAAIGAARQEAQDGILTEVGRINEALREVAQLTRQIRDDIARGAGPAAALEDRRDAAIARLSESLEVRAYKGADGSITLVARGGIVLPLSEQGDAFATAPAQLGPAAFHGTPGGSLPGITLAGIDVTDRLAGGRLAEYVALRDETLPRYQAELDLLAAQMAWRLDQQGLRLLSTAAGTVPDATRPYAGSAMLGFAGTIRVNPAVSADPRLVRDGTHSVTGAPGGPTDFAPNPSGGPAGFVALLDRVLERSFGAEAAPGAPWAPIQTSALGPDGGLASPFGAPRSIADYAAAVTSAHTADRAAATAARERAEAVRDGLSTRFDQQSGVDVDKEMAAMVTLQNAYAANAKVLSAVQAMWDQLLGAVR